MRGFFLAQTSSAPELPPPSSGYLCTVNLFSTQPATTSLTEGMPHPLVIAGPCSAETEEQLLETAVALAATGQVHMLRAGIWKPRTRPQSFEGVGDEGLAWLVRAKEASGLPVCTEVANARHVEACLAAGLDAVWIGARTTVSPFAVQEIAEALRGTRLPVIVKNPMHADLKLWIGAIERVQAQVVGPVLALHRGFTGYQHKDFRNAPMWEIPIALRAEKPEVPVLCDPSHIGGRRELLEPVAQKAMDLGMAGLMLEVHPRPAEAWSDAEQQITPDRFLEMMLHLTIRAELPEGNLIDGLAALRLQMDSVDEQLVELLAARMDLARSIGRFKKEHGITILQLERWKHVFASRSQWGAEHQLGETFMLNLLEQVHNESIRVQTEVMNEKKSTK